MLTTAARDLTDIRARLLRTMAAVLVLALVSAACGDDDPAATTAPPEPTTRAVTTASPTIDPSTTTLAPTTQPPPSSTAIGEGVIVADHRPPGRAFTVTATDDGRCIEVTAGGATEGSCALPLSAGLGVAVIGAGGDQYVVGLLTDPAITRIVLIGVDDAPLAEEIEIVDVGGGVRAFAPRISPLSLAAVEGLDDADRLVTRVDL